MADRTTTTITTTSTALARPVWMIAAEEAKLKSEAEKAAAAKAAFDATFKDVSRKEPASPDSDGEETEDLTNKPIGPVDPSKCTAAGAGIAGGSACAASSFVVITKDSDGRKFPNGGALLKVRISPGVGVGGSDQEGMVKDQGDGSYTVTYVVPKRGNYMVYVECNGKPIMGSPFPVFFSSGSAVGAIGATGGLGGLLGIPSTGPFPNMINQTMPNMPNYAASVSGAFPGLLGMIPGVVPGETGGVLLPGIGASLGEVCREFLNGRCAKTDCKFNHPPENLLMTALAATTSMGSLSQVPMAPSAAAMAAAQAIVAMQQLQAHAAKLQAQNKSSKDSDSPDTEGNVDALKRTLQVSNLSPLLTEDKLKQLFNFFGAVVECSIADSKHFAYIEYSKPEEAKAGLAMNNMDVGGRPLNVEMAKSLPPKPPILNSALGQSAVMQQAVAMQQMHFQQALLAQQTLTTQNAASRAATMKSATELAAARAAEISKMLKPEGVGNEEEEAMETARSPPGSRPRSKSRSRSPVKYRRSRRSCSFSPAARFARDRRSRSPRRSRHQTDYGSKRRSYREVRDNDRAERRERERSRDRYSSRRNRRSVSPRTRKTSRVDSVSPKRRRESLSPRTRKSSRKNSKSPPRRTRESRSPPRRTRESRSPPRRIHESKASPRRTHESKSSPRRSSPRRTHESRSSPRRTHESRSSPRRTHENRSSPRRTHENRSSPRRIHESRSSPRRTHESRSSPRRAHESRSSPRRNVSTSHHRRRSRSKSVDGRAYSDGRRGRDKSERSKLEAKSTEKIHDVPDKQLHSPKNSRHVIEDEIYDASDKQLHTSKNPRHVTENTDSDSSPTNSAWPKVIESQNGCKKSLLEDGDVGTAALSNDRDFLSDDSTQLAEDRTAGSPLLKAHTGCSNSPEVDKSHSAPRGTGDLYLNYKLDDGSLSHSLVFSAGDDDECGSYDKVEHM